MNNPIVTLPIGTKLPLWALYKDTVGGTGFLAQVEFRGRILAVIEGDCETWIYGAEPSGWAECGADLFDAHNVFRQSFTALLYDIASTASGYESFRAQVESFVSQRSDAMTASWREAVTNIDPKIATRLRLKVVSANESPSVKVTEVALQGVTTEINKLDESPRPILARDKAA